MLSHSETIVDLKLVFLNQQSFSNFPVKYWKNKIHLSTRVRQHRSENAVGQHLQTYHTLAQTLSSSIGLFHWLWAL